jgi:hypothetical protein
MIVWNNKIRFVDSIRRPVFERFVLWIHFVKTKIPNYSIRFGRIRIRFPHPYNNSHKIVSLIIT